MGEMQRFHGAPTTEEAREGATRSTEVPVMMAPGTSTWLTTRISNRRGSDSCSPDPAVAVTMMVEGRKRKKNVVRTTPGIPTLQLQLLDVIDGSTPATTSSAAAAARIIIPPPSPQLHRDIDVAVAGSSTTTHHTITNIGMHHHHMPTLLLPTHNNINSNGDGLHGSSCKQLQKKNMSKQQYIRYSAAQVQALESLYHDCPKPSSARRHQFIAEYPILQTIHPKQIKVWFQNRRCREKQKKETTRLQTVNSKLTAMNKLLMEENERLQHSVQQLMCENNYLHQLQLQASRPSLLPSADAAAEPAAPAERPITHMSLISAGASCFSN